MSVSFCCAKTHWCNTTDQGCESGVSGLARTHGVQAAAGDAMLLALVAKLDKGGSGAV